MTEYESDYDKDGEVVGMRLSVIGVDEVERYHPSSLFYLLGRTTTGSTMFSDRAWELAWRRVDERKVTDEGKEWLEEDKKRWFEKRAWEEEINRKIRGEGTRRLGL